MLKKTQRPKKTLISLNTVGWAGRYNPEIPSRFSLLFFAAEIKNKASRWVILAVIVLWLPYQPQVLLEYFALSPLCPKRVNLSTAFKEFESSITFQLRERRLPTLLLQAQPIQAASPHPSSLLELKLLGSHLPGSQCFLNPVLEGGWFLARGRRQWNVLWVGMVTQDSRRRRKLREKLVSQRKKAAQFGWQSLQSGGEGQAINKVRREFPVYTSRAGSLFPGPWSGVSDNRGQLSWAFLCEWQRGGVGEGLDQNHLDNLPPKHKLPASSSPNPTHPHP